MVDRKISRIHKLLILVATITVLSNANDTFAEKITIVKEVNYQVGILDNETSSHTMALEHARRLLFEELAVYLINNTKVKDYQLSKDQVSALSAGIVALDILNEKMNGGTYYLKASISTDSNELPTSINDIRFPQARVQDWGKIWKKAYAALQDGESIKQSKNRRDDYVRDLNVLRAMDWFYKGFILLIGNKLQGSIDAFSKAVELDPQFYWAFNSRAGAYHQLSNYHMALRDYDKAIEINPLFEKAYFNRGRTYEAMGNHQQSIASYDKVIALNPKDEWAYNNRGWANYMLGNYDLALRDFNKAIELVPSLEKAYYNRGSTFFALKDYPQAIASYSKVIELNPKNAWAYHDRGQAYSLSHNSEKAINDLNKAVELEPDSITFLTNRGAICIDGGDYEQALLSLNKSIALNANYVWSYINRGRAFVGLGDYDRALKDFDRAAEMDPNNRICYRYLAYIFMKRDSFSPSTLSDDSGKQGELKTDLDFVNRGLAYLQTGDYQLALKYLNSAIKINPKNAEIYLLTASCYGATGNNKNKIESLKYAARLGSQYAQDALKSQRVTW